MGASRTRMGRDAHLQHRVQIGGMAGYDFVRRRGDIYTKAQADRQTTNLPCPTEPPINCPASQQTTA